MPLCCLSRFYGENLFLKVSINTNAKVMLSFEKKERNIKIISATTFSHSTCLSSVLLLWHLNPSQSLSRLECAHHDRLCWFFILKGVYLTTILRTFVPLFITTILPDGFLVSTPSSMKKRREAEVSERTEERPVA